MRFLTTIFAGLLLAACSATDIDDIEFSGTMTVTPLQVTVGDTVSVVLEAEGPRLLSFLVDWGDESSDFLSVAGSQTARWTAKSTYAEPGTYEITGRIDELADTIVRMATVSVTAAAAHVRIPTIFEEAPR